MTLGTVKNDDIPEVKLGNTFLEDPLAKFFFKYFWQDKKSEKYFLHLENLGLSAKIGNEYAMIADKKSPQHIAFDSHGYPQNTIDFDSSYRRLEELSYGEKIISLKFEEEFLGSDKSLRHQVGFAGAYYFAQIEPSLFCPICMTDALARVLEIHGDKNNPRVQMALKRLSTNNMEKLWQGAMFLTERSGGSDVGSSQVTAEMKKGEWFLSGHKWFCSNADAKVILALARMSNEKGELIPGTKGLGLFLILRDSALVEKSMQLHRLKNKLGVRSMASGEFTFDQCPAILVGGAGVGFKMMTDMVNMSRMYNAVASIAISKRSILEAHHYGIQRKAFGKKLSDLPLWKMSLAELTAEHHALQSLVFYSVRCLDQSDLGDKNRTLVLRMLTPIIKALTAKFSVFAASECLELIGGIAYIEEHVMPRMLRDAQVLPIWEGTTNIQSLDLLRVFSKDNISAILTELEKEQLVTAPLKSALATLQSISPEKIEYHAKWILEKLGREISLALLEKQLVWSRSQLGGEGFAQFLEASLKILKQRTFFNSPLAVSTQSEGSDYDLILKNFFN